MSTIKKSEQALVSLSKKWQSLFVVITLLSWLSSVGIVIFSFTGPGSYINSGTWTFQITTWLLTLGFLLIALAFVWNRCRTLLQKLFMACLISSMGLAVFWMIHGWENALRYRYFPPAAAASDDKSLWTAYGYDWTIMLLGVVIYAGILFWLRRRLGAK